MKPREVRDALADMFDKVSQSKTSGEWTGKRTYFYRHGMDCGRLEQAVRAKLPGVVILESIDKWNPWPRDSYFQIRFRFPEENEGRLTDTPPAC